MASPLTTNPLEVSAAVTDLRINEIESNTSPSSNDWVEIYNPTGSPVSLVGLQFRDNDPDHPKVVLASGTVPANGYAILEETIDFPFGLGDGDSVTLWQSDGTTVIDTHTWGPHAATTYGRCPNGTGSFVTTASSTKGAANDCSPVNINEVESDDAGGDWIELYNFGDFSVDLSGFLVRDSGDASTYTIPAATTLAPGAYLVLNAGAQFAFTLDASDSARLFEANGTTLVDSVSWTSHAATSLGRCPNGTGNFFDTVAPTKNAANSCPVVSSTVKINEVESDGTVDFIELFNPGTTAADISGFKLIDSGSIAGAFIFPNGTILAPGAFLVLNQNAPGSFTFGLSSGDSARLFSPIETLIDTYTWTAHAPTTYGRCPDGTGPFVPTLKPTPGAANCPTLPAAENWPGNDAVVTVDEVGLATTNMSGLIYEAGTPDVLWAVRNDDGTLFRLVFNGTNWVNDTANSWGAGKLLRYPGGTGDPDAESVTYAAGGSAAGMFVSTERNNAASGTSRPAILQFDPTAAGAELTAVREWNLTANLPGLGANLGLEAIAWVPDAFLTTNGFWDESLNKAYSPADYPLHVGGGLFFVGVEANGNIYTYALNSDSTFTRISGVASGLPSVMGFEFDRELGEFWAWCDNSCVGFLNQSVLLEIGATGRLGPTHRFERPEGLSGAAAPAGQNVEGFAVTPQSHCVDNRKPAFWADDNDTNGHSIYQGTVDCYINDDDPDDDNDGIADVIDLDPETASTRFSDVILGGATSGEILAPLPAGFAVTVTDLGAPGGVHIKVTGSGPQEVRIALDGKLSQFFFKVGEYDLTDPTRTVEVKTTAGGPARIVLYIAGQPVEVIVEVGETALITENTDNQGRLIDAIVKSLAGTVSVGGAQVGPNTQVVLRLPSGCSAMTFDKVIVGGPGNDTLSGTGLRELILGNGGNDTITGGAGNDCIAGDAGDDRISGGSGNDRLYGDADNDTLSGDSGTDIADGGIGGADKCDAESKTACES